MEIQRCQWIWDALNWDAYCLLDTSEASRPDSTTRFNQIKNTVFLGANVLPGSGISVCSRMSSMACLAHELTHAIRFDAGYDRPFEIPDRLIDEAETSLDASFTPVISVRDREDLVEHARDLLIEWLKIQRERQ